jgi:hypothetical protein
MPVSVKRPASSSGAAKRQRLDEPVVEGPSLEPEKDIGDDDDTDSSAPTVSDVSSGSSSSSDSEEEGLTVIPGPDSVKEMMQFGRFNGHAILANAPDLAEKKKQIQENISNFKVNSDFSGMGNGETSLIFAALGFVAAGIEVAPEQMPSCLHACDVNQDCRTFIKGLGHKPKHLHGDLNDRLTPHTQALLQNAHNGLMWRLTQSEVRMDDQGETFNAFSVAEFGDALLDLYMKLGFV